MKPKSTKEAFENLAGVGLETPGFHATDPSTACCQEPTWKRAPMFQCKASDRKHPGPHRANPSLSKYIRCGVSAHVFSAQTLPMRGLACPMAERAQQAVITAPYLWSVMLCEAAHMLVALQWSRDTWSQTSHGPR